MPWRSPFPTKCPSSRGGARDDPSLRPSPDQVLANLREVVSAGCAAGVDLILLEMMSRPLHIAPALKAAGESGFPYWCGLSARSVGGRIVSYVWENYPFGECVKAVLTGRPDVVGIMHTNVNVTGPALGILRRHWKGPMMAYPDFRFFPHATMAVRGNHRSEVPRRRGTALEEEGCPHPGGLLRPGTGACAWAR